MYSKALTLAVRRVCCGWSCVVIVILLAWTVEAQKLNVQQLPDPRTHPLDCNLDVSGSLCDPAKVLDSDEVNDLLQSIRQFEATDYCFGCQCGSTSRKNRIMVAIVPQIERLSGNVAVGFDNQLAAAEEFAIYLRDKAWSRYEDDCRAFIVVVHDATANLSWISTNTYARKVISDSCVTDTAVFARKTFLLDGKRKEGILYLTDTFRAYFDGSLRCSSSSAAVLSLPQLLLLALLSITLINYS